MLRACICSLSADVTYTHIHTYIFIHIYVYPRVFDDIRAGFADVLVGLQALVSRDLLPADRLCLTG